MTRANGSRPLTGLLWFGFVSGLCDFGLAFWFHAVALLRLFLFEFLMGRPPFYPYVTGQCLFLTVLLLNEPLVDVTNVCEEITHRRDLTHKTTNDNFSHFALWKSVTFFFFFFAPPPIILTRYRQ